MMHSIYLTLCFLPLALTVPTGERRQLSLGPKVQTQHATVVGTSAAGVDSFKGIPFAQPPTGQLRLKPPQPIVANLGTVDATGVPRACPQFFVATNTSSLPSDTLAKLSDTPALQGASDSGEDCLTLNVQRPSIATAGSNLPVLFWIFGGGFEFGSTQTYDATQLILTSLVEGKEIIYVSVNYRLGGFGFLPGKEIKADGSASLGLLDQRLGLQWVADNIHNFGGDPSKVTIWGESAGSISVFDQMALYNGNNKYNGNALFRAAIMDSGSIVPADPVDCAKSQAVYNTVVKNAGCSAAANTLACLRGLDYQTYLNAANSVPSINSYQSVALAYVPRPDGVTLISSPDVLAKNGQYAKVPMIIGDQEDEGTLFSLNQYNISTTAQLVQYFQDFFFHDATLAQIQNLVSLYPDDPSAGSPFRTGLTNNIYPQYKRLAAMLGDLSFTLARRLFLSLTSAVAPSVPSWSYLASYDYGTAVLGTFHASDILTAYGIEPGLPSSSIQAYYLSFVTQLNPNLGTVGQLNWPQWNQGNMLMNFNEAGNVLIVDNFRQAAYNYIKAAGKALYV